MNKKNKQLIIIKWQLVNLYEVHFKFFSFRIWFEAIILLRPMFKLPFAQWYVFLRSSATCQAFLNIFLSPKNLFFLCLQHKSMATLSYCKNHSILTVQVYNSVLGLVLNGTCHHHHFGDTKKYYCTFLFSIKKLKKDD